VAAAALRLLFGSDARAGDVLLEHRVAPGARPLTIVSGTVVARHVDRSIDPGAAKHGNVQRHVDFD